MKVNWAWITGFYEGEGSVGCYKRHELRAGHHYNYHFLKFTIGQKEKTPLQLIKQAMGCGYLYHTNNRGLGGGKIWMLQFTHAQGRRFAKQIRPFMCSPKKIQQLTRALRLDKKYTKAR